MREIKFRAWDKEKQEMLYPNDFFNFSVGLRENRTEVMQFSGILDKNNQEIFEDDIVKVNVNVMTSGHPYTGDDEWIDNDYYAVVKFQPSRGYFGKVFKAIDLLDGQKVVLPRYVRLASYRTEKIGNIYENKELLI